MNIELYVIIDLTRTQASDNTVFWKPKEYGYTTHLNLAGLYSLKRSEQICRNSSDNLMILYSEAKKLTEEVITKDTIFEYLRNKVGV